jgi:predicted RNase H-like HicB family nuclease
MKFDILVEKDAEGFYQVEVRDFPEIITYGKSEGEALKNAREAIECHLEALKKSNKSFQQLEVPA